MSVKVRKNTSDKVKVRSKNRRRVRGKISGTADRPRFSVFRSNAHLSVQLIDDVKGSTLVAAGTRDEEVKGRANVASATTLGGIVAKRALAKGIDKVVFDRSGYVYHGKVKALADAAREGGLKF